MKVVYIAGPIRAKGPDGKPNTWLRELNIRMAELWALEVWNMGAAAICPHSMNRFYDDGDIAKWLKGDLAIIDRCDAVLMCPGWQQSEGSRVEHAHALAKGVPVFYSLGRLYDWLNLSGPPPREADPA